MRLFTVFLSRVVEFGKRAHSRILFDFKENGFIWWFQIPYLVVLWTRSLKVQSTFSV